MNDSEVDLGLAALLADPSSPTRDSVFAERIIALAAYELTVRRSWRSAVAQIGREAIGLATILASFVGLASAVPDSAAGLGDAISFGSPAMLGLIILVAWVVATRGSTALR